MFGVGYCWIDSQDKIAVVPPEKNHHRWLNWIKKFKFKFDSSRKCWLCDHGFLNKVQEMFIKEGWMMNPHPPTNIKASNPRLNDPHASWLKESLKERNNQKDRGKENTYIETKKQIELHNAYKTLYITSNAPKEVVSAVFKVLSLQYHPDRGGSEDISKKINAAKTIIYKNRGWS